MIKQDSEGRIVSVHTETREIVQHISDRSIIVDELTNAEAALVKAQTCVDEFKQDLADFDRISSEVTAGPAPQDSEAV